MSPVTNANDRAAVASDVFTWCTREKTETWHVVRNHNALGVVERVICKSCGSEHRYRSTKASAEAAASNKKIIVKSSAKVGSSTATKSSGSELMEASWFSGIKSWGDKDALAYAPQTTFSKGDVVDHAVFGKGVVQARRENKIDVLFKMGLKTLPSKP